MVDEPYTTQPKNSAGTSQPSMNQRLAYASQRAEVLFGCYRRGDANDPERYVASIAAVLSSYDFELIKEVTDPRTGICTSEKYMSFMPNVGELKRYCEAEAARIDRLKRLGELPTPDFNRLRLAAPDPRDAPPGAYANVFVPDNSPRYPALVKWAEDADRRQFRFGCSSDNRMGIWIAHDIWDQRSTVARQVPIPEKQSFALSEAALKVMREVDAARSWGEGEAAE